MKIQKFILVVLICLGITSLAQVARAEIIPTSKEAFLTAWEAYMKADPSTVVFEKTSHNTYAYETNMFPYKGTLTVLNVFLDDKLDYYQDYDLNSQTMLRGVAEVELSGATSEDLYQKYPNSYAAWKSKNFLFFNAESGKWLNSDDWKNIPPKPEQASCYNSTLGSDYKHYVNTFLPLFFLIVFLIFFIRWVSKKQKTQIDKYDQYQKEGIERYEQSIALQRQSIALLQQLVDKK